MLQLINELSTPVMVGNELRTVTSLNLRAARALAQLSQLAKEAVKHVTILEPTVEEAHKEYQDAISKEVANSLA